MSRVRDLRVPGRTSTFSFKGQKLDAREIGQKLNVKTMLEGSVQVMGERLRVSAQLINAEDGFQLWSERYDRKTEDVFAVQDDIARAIVDTLKVEILGEKRGPLGISIVRPVSIVAKAVANKRMGTARRGPRWGKKRKC